MLFGPDGNLYVTSRNTNEVLQYQGLGGASPGAFIDDFVSTSAGGLDGPRGLVFDTTGNLYVASLATHEVLRYSQGFTVSLSLPSVDEVTVDFATSDGTALTGNDYTAASGTLTFAPGETTKRILVPALDDIDLDADEIFNVTLSNATGGATIDDGQGVATITNDDTTRQISINDVATVEGDDSWHYRGAIFNGLPGTHFNPTTIGPDGDVYTAVGTGADYNTIQ